VKASFNKAYAIVARTDTNRQTRAKAGGRKVTDLREVPMMAGLPKSGRWLILALSLVLLLPCLAAAQVVDHFRQSRSRLRRMRYSL